jgi:raffinose/stachyose/melibiose transport system permease protein
MKHARLLLLLALAALMLLPLAATVLGGFKALGELRTQPLGLPEVWQWQNHTGILSSARFWQQLGNSCLIAALTVGLTLVISALAAFAFVRMRFALARQLLGYLLLGLLFPAATAVLPLFIRIRDLGLLDSAWGVVLPQVAFGLATAVLLLRNAFAALPQELFEAAVMDHCSPWRCFTRIVLPLSRPILATVAVITAVHSWNAYLLPLVVLNRESLYPWPLGLMAYQGEFSTDWQLVLAFVTLTLLPMVLLFLLAQRHIVAGLTAGAVKG